jgi:hypothetical protein
MDNHVHLLFETPEPNLVRGMRRLNQVYTQNFNRRRGRVGHLLQGRYKSILVEKQSHLLELCRYVVLNPVRAGMVRTAEEWRWSSYRATAGSSALPDWLQADWILNRLAADPQTARETYRGFIAEGMDARSPRELLRGQIWLGGEEFRERMSRLIARQDVTAIPREQILPQRPIAEEVLSEVADAFGLSAQAVLDRTHQPAFKAALYLLRRACNLPLGEVAHRAGLSPSRVSRIQAELERSELSETTEKLLRRYKVKH